jgi:hypothetical protein
MGVGGIKESGGESEFKYDKFDVRNFKCYNVPSSITIIIKKKKT